MATIKISNLTPITYLNPNTSNVSLVGTDKESGITGRISGTVLADGLYRHNVLNVGNTSVSLPNTIAQFAYDSENYIQTNLVNNTNGGSADHVITANTGTDTTYFIDMGYANRDFVPGSEYNSLGTSISALDGYLYVQGNSSAVNVGGNLVIGTTTTGTELRFIVGGGTNENVVAALTATQIRLNRVVRFGDGTTQNTSATSHGVYANGAFNKANSAYASQNTTGIIANSAFIQGNAAYVHANSSYEQANGASLYANGAFVQSNAAFLVANTPTHVANSAALYANGAFTQANAAFIKANTPHEIANSAALYANGAFEQSNVAFLVANTPTHVANSAASYANSSFSKANSAYVKANNALANTTGIFDGTLTVTQNVVATGNVISNYGMSIRNTGLAGQLTPYFTIIGTANYVISTPSNPGYTIHTATEGEGNRISGESYGNGANNYVAFIGRRARGTADTPQAVQNGDVLARLGGNGYGSTKFSQYADARVEFVAVENHTDSSKGTQIQFWTTPAGSNVAVEIGTMNGNTVTFSGAVNPIKGFIFTPNTLSTLTTLNVDFTRDNLIKFDVNDNATITLSNYVNGKVIEVWITNSAAQNKTITHGCLANNSTAKSTSFTILAGACAYLRYFSINGDQANTYVSIVA